MAIPPHKTFDSLFQQVVKKRKSFQLSSTKTQCPHCGKPQPLLLYGYGEITQNIESKASTVNNVSCYLDNASLWDKRMNTNSFFCPLARE